MWVQLLTGVGTTTTAEKDQPGRTGAQPGGRLGTCTNVRSGAVRASGRAIELASIASTSRCPAAGRGALSTNTRCKAGRSTCPSANAAYTLGHRRWKQAAWVTSINERADRSVSNASHRSPNAPWARVKQRLSFSR